MSVHNSHLPPDLKEGARCVAGPGGRWGAASIHRLNEDGTFTIEFDVKEMIIMPYWYGVTASELSFDDSHFWDAVFRQISSDGENFTLSDLPVALTRLGYAHVEEEQIRQTWEFGWQKLFNLPPGLAPGFTLDQESTYQFFLLLGLSAKRCADILKAEPSSPWHKQYWNQTRMGGRDPNDVRRAVTLDDAFAALGVTKDRADRTATKFVEKFEQKEGVQLPARLKQFLCRRGVVEGFAQCHPNDPYLVPFAEREWELERGLRESGMQGDCGIRFVLPHSADFEWWAVFDEGEEDARVFARWDDVWLPTAPEIGMFIWDVAQTGLAWFQEVQFNGGKPVGGSDIGLVLDQ